MAGNTPETILQDLVLRLQWLKWESFRLEVDIHEANYLLGRRRELRYIIGQVKQMLRVWNPNKRRVANFKWLFHQLAAGLQEIIRRVK